jgi:hypothetical protein
LRSLKRREQPSSKSKTAARFYSRVKAETQQNK